MIKGEDSLTDQKKMDRKLRRAQAKERRKRQVGISKRMTPIVMILVVIVALIFLNINSLTHALNRKSYERVTAAVVEKTTDPFAMVIPMATVSYVYDGNEYNESQYFITQPLFGISREVGTEHTVYVNTQAPNHFLFKEPFFVNWLNWLLILMGGVFGYIWIKRMKQLRQNHKEKKSRRANHE